MDTQGISTATDFNQQKTGRQRERSAVRHRFVVALSDVHVTRRFWLLPGPFLDHRNRCPKEQRNEDAVGDWFHQPLLAYHRSSSGWCLLTKASMRAAQECKCFWQLRACIPTENFRRSFSYAQGLQKPPCPPSLSFHEFQGVRSLVTVDVLQGFPPWPTALALAKPVRSHPKTTATTSLFGLVSLDIRLFKN